MAPHRLGSSLGDKATRMRMLSGCVQMRSRLTLDARRPDSDKGAVLEAAQHVYRGAATGHGSPTIGTAPSLIAP